MLFHNNISKTTVFSAFLLILLMCASLVCMSEDVYAAESVYTEKSLTLTYAGNTYKYKGVRGKLCYNHSTYVFKTMPIVKIDSVLYMPAQEFFEDVLGCFFTYTKEDETYRAVDPDLNLTISFKAGEGTFIRTKNNKETTYKLPAPIRMIACGSGKAMPCIPATKLFKALGFTSSWSLKNALYTVQKNSFFSWKKEKEDPSEDINEITKATGVYKKSGNIGMVQLSFFGDKQTSFDSATVTSAKKIITITLPSSSYILSQTLYDRFKEIADKMEVSQEKDKQTVKIVITCFEKTEFTYTTSDNMLQINLLHDYSNPKENPAISNRSITIPRPSGILLDKVSNEDCYDAVHYKKRFKIILSGDHIAFFKKNPVITKNKSIKKVKIYLSKKKNTVISVDTKTLQGYKIYRDGTNFVVSMDKPKKMYKSIIILDAGHGGFDSGATYKGYLEKTLNYKIMVKQMQKYFRENRPDIKVYWTRLTDEFVTLENRAKFAKKTGADLFMSLHMNAAGSSANGTEVFYCTTNNKKSFSGITSAKIAALMDKKLVSVMNTIDRGVKTANYHVLKYNTVPSVLMELGFLTGDKDHVKLIDSAYQKKATKAIKKMIVSIFNKYPTGR